MPRIFWERGTDWPAGQHEQRHIAGNRCACFLLPISAIWLKSAQMTGQCSSMLHMSATDSHAACRTMHQMHVLTTSGAHTLRHEWVRQEAKQAGGQAGRWPSRQATRS